MASLTPADFQRLVAQNNGDEALARKLMAQRGYTIEGEDVPVDDEETDLAVEPGGNLAALQGVLDTERQSIGDLYDTITQNIQKRYRAPDINDMLVAIGTGMMSAPGENDAGGFGGAVQRGLRGIGTYAASKRAYDEDMNKTMSQLELQRAQALAGLSGKYATGAAALLKPRTPSTAAPVTVGADMLPRTRKYGTVIKEPPQAAIYELQAYLANPNATPQNKMQARRDFDTNFGYGAADIFAGEQ